ncbi:NADP-dependent oxidoreductase [Hazenella sp. IB182357]|uniref:NADP-dependent oxidoreductase n=1 Tax=Polycladospora coralii TaxID=2771432 RepID=A0A926N6P2_9BACL|nr:NADP-dependent oxidoreductase [Polycladospora coralii]MBD1372566.1 NADP-dependent oxidoreductase [Polycladospora coralii]MBS7531311.1 NADP-dependent oxidoreductase [Polycladospora coralii]
MKAMTVAKYGADQKLSLTELPTPTIQDDDVLVQIHAASVNPVDALFRNGNFRLTLKHTFPLILGNDFAGTVVETGKNVSRFKIGDRVYGRPHPLKGGTFAEYIAVDQSEIALTPKNLTIEEAASLPLVGLTSVQALYDVLQLQKGQKILIHAGSGGVGTFAIQLAKHIGAYVATTTSEKGADLAKEMGADLIINYKKQKFEDVISGYDAVFDTLGKESLERSFQVLKAGGKVVSVSGPPTKELAEVFDLSFILRMLISLGSRKMHKLAKQNNTTYRFLAMQPNGKQLEMITKWVEDGVIKPHIDRTFSLADAQAGLEYVESKRAKGKVMIHVSDPS